MDTQPTGGSWPGPVGRPAGAHWWSIQPPPPASPISARRAYAEVLVVFAAFFAASVLAGGEALAHRYPAPSGSWAIFTPAAVSELATSTLAVLVVVLLSSRRGITPRSLGLGMPRKADGRPAAAQGFRIGVWAVTALVIGGVITARLATGKLGQPHVQDNSYLLYATTAALAAGIIEETVVLAFLVSTLRQASRPLPEIVIVAVLLRCSYHDYYGPGVVGIAVWAATFIWLYLRAGSVIPLIVVHILWDGTIFWSQRWHAILTAEAVVFLLLPIAAGITWLVEVLQRNGGGQRPGGGTPAAPYGAWLPGDRNAVPQGAPPQGWPPPGGPPQAFPPQGGSPQGGSPQGWPPQGCSPQAWPPRGAPPQGGPPQAGSPPDGQPR